MFNIQSIRRSYFAQMVKEWHSHSAGLVIVIILLKPDLGNLGFGNKYKEFQVTTNASAVLEKSLNQKHPVFLEFYAEW